MSERGVIWSTCSCSVGACISVHRDLATLMHSMLLVASPGGSLPLPPAPPPDLPLATPASFLRTPGPLSPLDDPMLVGACMHEAGMGWVRADRDKPGGPGLSLIRGLQRVGAAAGLVSEWQLVRVR